MIHEKIFTHATGREIKIIIKGFISPEESAIRTELEVLIKEPREEYFHAPIGLTHPQFWKLKRLDKEQAKQLQKSYSGVSDKQINNVLKEFDEIAHSSVLF